MKLPPIDTTLGENIVQLPVGHKPPPEQGSYLRPVPYGVCMHWRGPYEVDIPGAKCKCLQCGAEVSAIFVLQQLMNDESQWKRERAVYQDEMKRLAERSRTKCQHCGELTRISRA